MYTLVSEYILKVIVRIPIAMYHHRLRRLLSVLLRVIIWKIHAINEIETCFGLCEVLPVGILSHKPFSESQSSIIRKNNYDCCYF